MQKTSVSIITRVRNGETQQEIESETKRLNEQGIAVIYFNSQASLSEWKLRLAALSQ